MGTTPAPTPAPTTTTPAPTTTTPAPTPAPTTTTPASTTAAGPTWVTVAANAVCDTTQGEEFMQQSPGKVPSVEACQQGCEAQSGCQSISYLRSTWCSFYSTSCATTTFQNGAVAMRLQGPTTPAPATTAGTTAPTTPGTTTPTVQWEFLGANEECNQLAGEVFMSTSPGNVGSLDACKSTCQAQSQCKSITYFNSGWCSHYSSECTARRATSKANSYKIIGR